MRNLLFIGMVGSIVTIKVLLVHIKVSIPAKYRDKSTKFYFLEEEWLMK